MKRALQITGVLILIGVLVVSFVGIKMFNKPHQDILETAAAHQVSTEALINHFEADEQKANEKYLDQVIQVSGEITDISTKNGKSVLSLGKNGMVQQVICTLNASENKKVLRLKKGQQVTVKGVCTGFLMDVMLVRTVIISTN